MARFFSGSWLHGKSLLFGASAFLILFLGGAFSPGAADWRAQPMLQPQAQYMPLLPFLDYFIDENLSMDVEEAASPALSSSYQPLSLEKLPRLEGIVWLRFRLAPLPPDSKAPVYLLDMGHSVPGVPKLYDPARNELSGAMEWRENVPGQRNIILLPEAGNEPLTCYIRMDGLPGPWFSPIIRSPQNAAGNWGSLSRTGAILALAVVMVLCLLRGVSEKGQWRIWTALFVGVTLAQAIIGMPTVGDNFRMDGLVAILLPGIALMLLPHVGRHLMQTPGRSRSLDIQLILLSLPGAALALFPLIPGWEWLDRWLDLWPAGTALCIPTALAAWITGLGGSRRFLLGCIIPPLFVGIAILGLDFGLPPMLLASLPLWGIALSALLVAATKVPSSYEREEPQTVEKAKKSPKAMHPATEGETIINLDHPLDDPNLRIIEPAFLDGKGDAENKQEAILPMPNDYVWQSPQRGSDALETALRDPLDELMRQGVALGGCALPPAARSCAEGILAAGKRMAAILCGDDDGEPCRSPVIQTGGESFSLRAVLRKAHDSSAQAAENAEDALSWYMPPNMEGKYYGNGAKLEHILSLLLENAVRATSRGAVSLTAVKSSTDDKNRDEISFTVADNGKGYPPMDRSSLALTKAWELAGEYDGSIRIDSSPEGTSVTFSAKFAPVVEESGQESEELLPHVILACEDDSHRRELKRIIETLPCRIREAANMMEALDWQRTDASQLLITAGKLAMPASADMVREFVILSRDARLTRCHVLAITRDDSQWGRLKSSGFTHAMLEPVDPEMLRGTVCDLMGTPPGQIANKRHGPFEKPAAEKSKEPEVAPLLQLAQKKPADHISHAKPVSPAEETAPTKEAGEKESADDFAGFEYLEWLGGKADSPEDNASPEDEKKSAAGSGAPDQKEQKKAVPEAGKLVSLDDARLSSANGDEWVGEPVPLGDATEGQEEKDLGVDSDGSLVDFIVGVKEPAAGSEAKSESAPHIEEAGGQAASTGGEDVEDSMREARDNARLALAATRKNPAVSTFVNSSVELVTKAFAAALANSREKKNNATNGDEQPGSRPEPTPAGKPGFVNKKQKPEEPGVQLDPAIRAIVDLLDRAIGEAIMAFERGDGKNVAKYTGIIAKESNAFGLRSLARMAQCVERAGNANDLVAIGDLLPELANSVERNRIGLTHKNKPGDNNGPSEWQ